MALVRICDCCDERLPGKFVQLKANINGAQRAMDVCDNCWDTKFAKNFMRSAVVAQDDFYVPNFSSPLGGTAAVDTWTIRGISPYEGPAVDSTIITWANTDNLSFSISNTAECGPSFDEIYKDE